MEPIVLFARNPSPMTRHGNNTYLVDSHGQAALIDAGIGEAGHLADLAAALHDRQAHLASVLVTHGHRDHAGGAPAIAAAHPSAAFRKLPWPEEDPHYEVTWQPIADGEVVTVGAEELTALHTPGHSPDHLAFWHEASRAVFTGDLVVRGSSVMIHWSRGGDLAQYLASLERLLALEPRLLYPAHGTVIDDPRVILTQYLAHRRFREQQVLNALRAGQGTVEAIAESIYDGLAPALMPAARENVRAHLEKLRLDGAAAQAGERWTPK